MEKFPKIGSKLNQPLNPFSVKGDGNNVENKENQIQNEDLKQRNSFINNFLRTIDGVRVEFVREGEFKNKNGN